MRLDGRRTNELRPVTITPGFTAYAEGSALIEVGQTKVLCNVTIEETAPRWMQAQNKPGGWITAEYAMLPRSTHQRTTRETSGLRGRTHEISRLIGRSLRAAVNLEKLGTRTCIVDCDVLQADGGTRTAAITGGYVALFLSLKKQMEMGLMAEHVIKSPVAAVSVGIVNGTPVLDLCYAEDATAEVDTNIVMNAEGQFIEIGATAEGHPFSKTTFDEIIILAQTGINQLLSIQKNITG